MGGHLGPFEAHSGPFVGRARTWAVHGPYLAYLGPTCVLPGSRVNCLNGTGAKDLGYVSNSKPGCIYEVGVPVSASRDTRFGLPRYPFWPPFGRHLAVIWPPFGLHLAVIWPHLATRWGSFGYQMGLIWLPGTAHGYWQAPLMATGRHRSWQAPLMAGTANGSQRPYLGSWEAI